MQVEKNIITFDILFLYMVKLLIFPISSLSLLIVWGFLHKLSYHL